MFDLEILNELPEGSQQVDGTNINQLILYYNDEEIKEFKQLVKTAMKKEYPEDFQKANASDLVLKILRERYANV